jgi:hypothetical protein
VGSNRPLDLAPDVRHLLHQRQACPTPRGPLCVNHRALIRHSTMSAFTTRRTDSRTSGSSTSRDRFPRLGIVAQERLMACRRFLPACSKGHRRVLAAQARHSMT